MVVTLLFLAAGVSGSAALALIVGVVIYGGSDAFARVLARVLTRHFGIAVIDEDIDDATAVEVEALIEDTQEWDVETDFEEG